MSRFNKWTYSGLYTSALVAIPLEGVLVESRIVDLCTQTTVHQTYTNREAFALEAVYLFPLDTRSAICGFEVSINGRITQGVVQEIQQARRTYESAIMRGDSAQLLEQKREDVFEMKVGNLMPGEVCVVRITYVADLKIEEDAVRFFIPTFVAPRYTPAHDRAPPVSGSGAVFVPSGLQINVTMSMASAITRITSPTHAISVTHDAAASPRTATASLAAGGVTMLERDFVLLVATAEPHAPRVLLERSAAGTYAAAVTLAPNIRMAEQLCEFIFLVDRSGSMSGSKMTQAVNAITLFLRSLPPNCFFNVVSFGSASSPLWPQSQRYAQGTLDHALRHATSMSADMGGTEILRPLEWIFKQSMIPGGYKRQVFVLTDGEVSNTAAVIDCVQRNNGKARVFSLGLGHGASHELVEGIARAGRGTADFVLDDTLETKVIEQLDNALQPALSNVTVTWEGLPAAVAAVPVAVVPAVVPAVGGPPVRVSVGGTAAPPAGAVGSLLGYTGRGATMQPARGLPTVTAVDPKHVQGYAVAPFVAPPVFSGSRFLSYCLVTTGMGVPTAAVINAESVDGPLAVRIDVTPGDAVQGDVVHRMAARALIRDLERGTSWMHNAARPRGASVDEATVKAEIVRLGLTYSLVSKYTSFVAVEQRGEERVEQPVMFGTAPPQPTPFPAVAYAFPVAACAAPASFGRGGGRGGARGALDRSFFSMENLARSSQYEYRQNTNLVLQGDRSLIDRRTAAPMLEAAPPSIVARKSLHPRKRAAKDDRPRSRERRLLQDDDDDGDVMESCAMVVDEKEAVDVEDDDDDDDESASSSGSATPAVAAVAPSASAAASSKYGTLAQLLQCQLFDGSFAPGAALAAALGVAEAWLRTTLPAALSGLDAAVALQVWCTALALAHMRLRLAAQEDDWRLVAGKAQRWVRATAGAAATEVMNAAETVLQTV